MKIAEQFNQKKVREQFLNNFKDQFHYQSIMAVPKIEKIVINVCDKKMLRDKKLANVIQKDLTSITLQKPILIKAKTSVSNFKLRKGMPIGFKVTLRSKLMAQFYYKLVNIVLPNTRDFYGLPAKSFDKKGSYAFGVKEQLVFPELSYDTSTYFFGMDIVIVTSAKTPLEAYHYLKATGLPLKPLPKKEIQEK
ncbi:50S ribosomal protein L5 [Mycoplasma sp. SG1]|uniref:50S ribosomal protein L5 n=1 Tax=Mycoplasma sp. SG1 TaxID=2810348 RepID=UPI0020252CF4|nr:50S ribosomal protein L5 [Mycoplasma sp. SG1]